MKEIALTKGKSVLVDDDDYWYLISWVWQSDEGGKTFYAIRRQHLGTVRGVRKGKKIYMHRVILARKLGHTNFVEVDHINRNGLDNRRDNLRPVTKKQNKENKGLRSDNKSGITGVSWNRNAKKWYAQFCHNGQRMYLGIFDTVEEAEAVVTEARRKYFTHSTD